MYIREKKINEDNIKRKKIRSVVTLMWLRFARKKAMRIIRLTQIVVIHRL